MEDIQKTRDHSLEQAEQTDADVITYHSKGSECGLSDMPTCQQLRVQQVLAGLMKLEKPSE